MNFTVEILRAAQKQLAKIDPQRRLRIIEAIYALAEDPRPASLQETFRPARMAH